MSSVVRERIQESPLVAAVVFTGVGVLPLFLVSAQILQIADDIRFGVAELAIATATYTGASAAAAGMSGGLVAGRGATLWIKIGTGLTIVSCLLAALTPVGWLIPVATAIGGAGNGLTQVAANLAIFDGVRAGRQGLAYGAKQSSVPMASVLAGLALPSIGLVLGWRWGFVIAAVLAALLLTAVPEIDTVKAQSRSERDQGRLPLATIPIALGGLTGAMAGNGVAHFVVPSAVEIGVDEGTAGAVLAMCSGLVVLVRIGAGWLVDKRGSTGHTEMIALASLGALGGLALAVANDPTAYLIAIPITLLGAWGWPGVFFFTVLRSFPTIPGRTSGLMLAGNLTGTLIGPVTVGFYASRGDFRSAWLFVSAAALLAAVGFASARLVAGRSAIESG